MPSKPVVRASSASYGRFSDLSIDHMEDITMPSSPAIPPVSTPATNTETPHSYTSRCLRDVFNKKASDIQRAQALYAVFTEIASELECTSQFTTVMTRIADNLKELGCKAKPCTLHCDKSHANPAPCHTWSHAPLVAAIRYHNSGAIATDLLC
ncbi:hypothetical protein JOM56_007376 [Amanita muscaria]